MIKTQILFVILAFSVSFNLSTSIYSHIHKQSALVTSDGLRRPGCVIGTHEDDWNAMSEKIQHDRMPMAFVRYGDGERMLILGQGVGKGTQAFGQDKFWHEGGPSKIGEDLEKSLRGHDGQQYYYGFASPRDDYNGLLWFLNNTEQRCGFITYANLWVNSFYKKTLKMLNFFFDTQLENIVIVANYEGLRLFGNKTLSLELPDDAAHFWEIEFNRSSLIKKVEILAHSVKHKLFIVSGGPLAKILIAYMWHENRQNTYIDFGSSIDEILKKRKTRPYMHEGNYYANLVDPEWWIANDGSLHTKP